MQYELGKAKSGKKKRMKKEEKEEERGLTLAHRVRHDENVIKIGCFPCALTRLGHLAFAPLFIRDWTGIYGVGFAKDLM